MKSLMLRSAIAICLSAVLSTANVMAAPEITETQHSLKTLKENDVKKTSGDTVLDGYVQTALENNKGLRAAFDAYRAAIEVIPQATALPDPMFQWTHFIDEIQTRTGPQNNKFMLSQKFPWKGKRSQAGKIAQDQAEYLWWKAVERKYEIIKNVKHIYAEYAYLAQNKRIVEENLTLLRNFEPVVQVRLRSGGSQGDLLRLQVEIGKLENELQSLEELRPALDRQLKAVMNQTSRELLAWPSAQKSSEHVYLTEDLTKILDKHNPTLKQLKWQIAQMDDQVTYRNLLRKPDVSVGVTYIDTGEASSGMRPSDSGDDPFGVTVGVTIPIWGKKYDAGVREARHKGSSFRHRLNQQQLDLYAQLEMESYRLQDSARSISLYRDTLIPRTRQAMDVIQVSYQSGSSTLLDIIDSERDLLMFEQSYWRAQRDYAQGMAAVEALCGGAIQ